MNVFLPQHRYEEARKLIRKTTIINAKQKNSLLESIKPLEEASAVQKVVPVAVQQKESGKEQQHEHEHQLSQIQTRISSINKIKNFFEKMFCRPVSFLSIALFAASVIMWLLRKRVGKLKL